MAVSGISRVLARCAIGLAALTLMAAAPSRTGAQEPYLPSVGQTCSTVTPGTAAVTFSWPAPPPGAIQQWLDLSLFNNGFAPGSFAGAGPFDPQTTSFTWDGILSGLTHYYRLNVVYADGWHAGPTGTFTSCEPGKAVLGDVRQFCAPEGAQVTFEWSPPTPPGTSCRSSTLRALGGAGRGTGVSSVLVSSRR